MARRLMRAIAIGWFSPFVRDPSPAGEFHLFSILIGFGVATLCATGLLFLVHMFEDFGKE